MRRLTVHGIAITASLVILVFNLCPDQAGAGENTYDLNADWSDISNPNGPWSYNDYNSVPLAHNYNLDVIDTWPIPQPGWTKPWLPVWFKATTTGQDIANWYKGDWQIGDIITHTNSSVSWTAEYDGTIDITGSLWVTRTREQEWFLYVDGVQVDGSILDGNLSSRTNQTYFNHTELSILAGQVVELKIAEHNYSNYGDYIGVNLTITDDYIIPEPVTMVGMIFGINAIGISYIKRRQS